MKPIMQHFTNGGTGITNFQKPERPKYEQAIAEFGDPNLVIVELPVPFQNGATPEYAIQTMHSLHDLAQRNDLSKFWECFHKINNPKP